MNTALGYDMRDPKDREEVASIKSEPAPDSGSKPLDEVECGNANLKGNVALTYKGGCGKKLNIKDAYRCGGCGGWFHKECMYKHFELEKEHDYGRVKAVKGFVDGLIDQLKTGTIVEQVNGETGLTAEEQDTTLVSATLHTTAVQIIQMYYEDYLSEGGHNETK